MSEGCFETSKQRQHQRAQSRTLQCWRSASGNPCTPLGCPPLLSQIIDTGVGICSAAKPATLHDSARLFGRVDHIYAYPSLAAALGDFTPVVLAELAIRPLLLSTLHACSHSLHQGETSQGGLGRSMPIEVWRWTTLEQRLLNSRPVGSAWPASFARIICLACKNRDPH
jgi:hypothetical protein